MTNEEYVKNFYCTLCTDKPSCTTQCDDARRMIEAMEWKDSQFRIKLTELLRSVDN